MTRHQLLVAAFVAFSVGTLHTPAYAQNAPVYVTASGSTIRTVPVADRMRDADRKPAESKPSRVKLGDNVSGFVFDGESKVLPRPTDTHTMRAQGTDDQFILRFRKPR